MCEVAESEFSVELSSAFELEWPRRHDLHHVHVAVLVKRLILDEDELIASFFANFAKEREKLGDGGSLFVSLWPHCSIDFDVLKGALERGIISVVNQKSVPFSPAC